MGSSCSTTAPLLQDRQDNRRRRSDGRSVTVSAASGGPHAHPPHRRTSHQTRSTTIGSRKLSVESNLVLPPDAILCAAVVKESSCPQFANRSTPSPASPSSPSSPRGGRRRVVPSKQPLVGKLVPSAFRSVVPAPQEIREHVAGGGGGDSYGFEEPLVEISALHLFGSDHHLCLPQPTVIIEKCEDATSPPPLSPFLQRRLDVEGVPQVRQRRPSFLDALYNSGSNQSQSAEPPGEEFGNAVDAFAQ